MNSTGGLFRVCLVSCCVLLCISACVNHVRSIGQYECASFFGGHDQLSQKPSRLELKDYALSSIDQFLETYPEFSSYFRFLRQGILDADPVSQPQDPYDDILWSFFVGAASWCRDDMTVDEVVQRGLLEYVEHHKRSEQPE